MNPFGPPFEKLGGETAGYCPTFTGDSTDWVGSNDGTASGGVSIVRDREKGGLQCWEFDGTGYVDLTTEQDFASDFTIAAWIKGSGSEIFWGSAVASESLQRIASTTIRSAFGTNADFTVPAADSEWHSVVLSRSSGTLRLYYDGEESSTGGIANTDTVHLGRVAGDFSGASFTGSVDDLRAFSRSLNATEIKELYKRGYQRRYAAEHLNPVLAIHPTEDKFGAVSGSTVALDLSGNGNNGTITGATYVNDSGRGGRKALSFDGTDYITTPNTSQYNIVGSTPEATLAAWIKTTDGRFVIFGGYSGVSPYNGWGFGYDVSGSASRLQFWDGSAWLSSSWAGNAINGEWHHVALKIVSGGVEFFLDGESLGASVPHSAIAESPVSLLIGWSEGFLTGNAYIGNIDAAQIFDYALSSDEIRLLAQSRTAKYIEPEDGLVAWYCPSQTPGDVAAGSGPINLLLDGNNGTLNGTATYDTADTDKSGSAALDLASGDYVDLTSELSYSGDFTASFWKQGNVSAKLVGSSSAAKSIEQTASTTMRVGFGTNVDFTVPANDANWHFVTVTRRDGTLRLYYDGTESSTGGVSNSDTVLVGRVGGDSTTQNYVGLVDNVKIYNRALYPREIAKQYAMERPGVAKSYNSLGGEGLNNYPAATLSHWRTDENTGTAVADSAPEANDGTLTGTWQAALGSWSQSSTDGSVAITALDFGDADAFTVAGRVKWDATSGGLFIDGVSQQSDTLIRFTDAAAATTDFTVPSMGTASDHHIAITRGNDNGIRVFLDSTESSTGEVNDANTDGVFDPNSFGNSDTWIDDLLVFHRELNANEISLLDSGPAPIFTGATLPTISPQESTECTVSYPASAFGLDPRWGAGTNGTVTEWLYWYLADDANGTNESLVAVTQDPAGYTPASGDVGKYLRVGIEPENSGGYDPAEFWYSDYTLIAAAGGGATVALTSATQTDSANAVAIVNARTYTLGTASETETANAVTVQQAVVVSLGNATETDVANAVSVVNPRSYQLGNATDSSAANALSVVNPRSYTLGNASESDTANAVAITNASTVSLGTASESCVANSLAISNPRTYTLTTASEVSIGRALTVVNPRSYSIGNAAESNTANALTVSLPGQTTAGYILVRNATLKTGKATATLRTGRATATLIS